MASMKNNTKPNECPNSKQKTSIGSENNSTTRIIHNMTGAHSRTTTTFRNLYVLFFHSYR